MSLNSHLDICLIFFLFFSPHLCLYTVLEDDILISLFPSSPVADKSRTKCDIVQMPWKCNKISRNVFWRLFVFNNCTALHTAPSATWGLKILMNYFNLFHTVCLYWKHLLRSTGCITKMFDYKRKINLEEYYIV